MNYYAERRYGGEFLISEGEGSISRETVVIKQGQVLGAGAPLGKITASSKYVAVAPAAADGSQTADCLLYDHVDATDGDVEAVVISRLAEYNPSIIPWGTLTTLQQAAIKASLAVKNLIARNGI